jgi:hypothetical protein
MNELFKISGYITKITTMSKNTIRLQVDSTENVSGEAMKRVFDMIDQQGNFLFAIRQLQPEDLLNLPIPEPEFKEDKSPSKRMKAVLYRLWEQKKEGYDDFELYYRFKMEKLIEVLKSKLEA